MVTWPKSLTDSYKEQLAEVFKEQFLFKFEIMLHTPIESIVETVDLLKKFAALRKRLCF